LPLAETFSQKYVRDGGGGRLIVDVKYEGDTAETDVVERQLNEMTTPSGKTYFSSEH
jgi:hypothetical protein